jgi:hypothetical protein
VNSLLRREILRIRTWPLSGVLLCGVANVLLFERGGNFFQGHGYIFLTCLIALPIVGGLVTSEKPFFTAAVLALGSVPPLNDMPPMSIVMWPFYELENGGFFTWLVHLPYGLAFTAVAGGMMFFAYVLPVLFGWSLKRTVVKRVS